MLPFSEVKAAMLLTGFSEREVNSSLCSVESVAELDENLVPKSEVGFAYYGP